MTDDGHTITSEDALENAHQAEGEGNYQHQGGDDGRGAEAELEPHPDSSDSDAEQGDAVEAPPEKKSNRNKFIVGGLILLVVVGKFTYDAMSAPAPMRMAQVAPSNGQMVDGQGFGSAMPATPIAAPAPIASDPMLAAAPAGQPASAVAPVGQSAPAAPVTLVQPVAQAAPVATDTAISDRLDRLDGRVRDVEQAIKALGQQRAARGESARSDIASVSAHPKVRDLSGRNNKKKVTKLIIPDVTPSDRLAPNTVKTAALSADAPAALPVVQPQPAAPRVSYVLKAVIPGQSWLMRNDGEMLVVNIGDAVPTSASAGDKVERIDPERFEVKMESGLVIR